MRVSDWSSDVCSSDLASGDKEQAFADRRRAVVAGPHRFPFHLVAEPAELADEQVEGFAFARRIRIPLAVDELQRPPGLKLFDVLQHDHARLAVARPLHDHACESANALADRLAALGLAEVLAVG